MGEATGYGEFRRGWPIVLAAFLGIGLGLSPLPFYTMGVFAPHLAHEFGWSTAQIMAGLTVTTLGVLGAAPLVGLLAVRFGVRRVALTSLVLFSLAFMSLALSTGSLVQFYVTWAAVAVLGAGTLPITWTRAVNDWFDVRKGLALGVSLMGTGLFGFLAKPALAWAIGHFGWRWAYAGLGALPLVVAFPVAFFLFHDIDDEPATPARPVVVVTGRTLGQALRDWRFWLIAGALVPVSLTLAGPVPNMENILTHGGLTPAVVLTLTPLIGLAALTGRIAGGWLLDRFWAPAVAFVIVSLPSVACWLLAQSTLDYPAAAVAIGLIGFALGVEYDLMAYFVARYFGMRSYAAIYGVLYVAFSLGSGVGPLIFGRVFDTTGSYRTALITSSVVLVVSAATLLLLGRYRDFATAAEA
jgi:MFS family permease